MSYRWNKNNRLTKKRPTFNNNFIVPISSTHIIFLHFRSQDHLLPGLAFISFYKLWNKLVTCMDVHVNPPKLKGTSTKCDPNNAKTRDLHFDFLLLPIIAFFFFFLGISSKMLPFAKKQIPCYLKPLFYLFWEFKEFDRFLDYSSFRISTLCYYYLYQV